jgi:hypothetical protein
MSTKRHHAEWLSLVEVSGPFLTMPVLEKVFPQGLDAHDPDQFAMLRAAYEEWDENQTGHRPSAAIHAAWIKFVLQQTLGLPDEVLAEGQKIPQTIKATVAEHGETLRPDFIVRNPEGVPDAGKTRLLIQIYPFEQNLEKPIAEKHWKASPATRMMELLHSTEVRLGLVTNGEHWMLVDAPRGETTGFASWYASLWLEEKITLQAFRSLVGVRRFFNVADDETLEAMFKESANYQNEVTDQLGLQVRRAVEVLIQSLDRADQDHGRSLLADVPEAVLYEAALTVMMRLVFLFSAEERELLLLGDPLYDQHYAVSTLVAQLQEAADQHGEEVLERRLDAWVRLLSTFRAVYGGVQHERMKLLAYSGNLFDPDRFPFLEGRKPGTSWRNTPANPLPVNNRTVLHLLRSLQYLEMQGEARRLSFRALDIEQIGHVYEGLLDHTAKRATEPVLGLMGTKGREPEIALKELESIKARGEDDLIEFLHNETGKSESALRNALEKNVEGDDASRLRAACGNEDALFRRVLPFGWLIRSDTFGKPVVIRKGSVFVTSGAERRSSGTYYTPRSLTETIVQYTLEPLVYEGAAQGKPKEEWKLRSAKELLDLKVCDMACGSGAFLVQACRYLSERLLEAWEEGERQVQIGKQEHLFEKKTATPPVVRITPYGLPSKGGLYEQVVPLDPDERQGYALRIVAQRCLYGVDKNPLAAEMAKLSLWLLTLAKDKPFTFLDHAIRCGDSLVGIHDLDQIKNFNLDPKQGRGLFTGPIFNLVDEAVALRKKIEANPANTVAEVEAQANLLAAAEVKTARLCYAADLLLSVEFQPTKDKDSLHNSMAIQAGHYVEHGTLEEFRAAARTALNGQPTFHWPMEFPEVIVDRGGFDAFVCNPPFMGGQKITGNLGETYREYLVGWLANGRRGSADLCSYFFLRASRLLREGGQFGFLATNTIAQGDTREVGLEQLIANGYIIPRALPSQPWPGSASLEVAVVWLRRGVWNGPFMVDGKATSGITAFLTPPGTVSGNPFRLEANEGKSFQGSIVLGIGFVLEPVEAHRLIEKNPCNKDVLLPYLSGEDLNSHPDQSASRWVVNFFDWPIEKAMQYPDCFRIVEEKVKPQRMRDNRKVYRDRWWQFAEKRAELYRIIAGLERVLVTARVSPTGAAIFVSPRQVLHEKVVVFPTRLASSFAVMQCSFHWAWAVQYTSTLGATTLNYSPSDCFDTFPFPTTLTGIDESAEQLHEHRRQIMLARQEGLTKTYNRFHDADETAADIQKLGELHVEMDNAVAAAYDWSDLDLGHGFHETKQGVRFTISEAARREVLGRLLKLNHERYAEEVAKGLHEKKKPRNTRKTRKKTEEGGGMFE